MKKARLPRDPVARAVMVAKLGTGEIEPEPDERNPKAVASGRKGGKKGGKARAAKLSAARRREIARKAAKARWAEQRESG